MTSESRYASRKFVLAATTILGCLILRGLGQLADGAFAGTVGTALTVYFAANVAQKKFPEPTTPES